MDRPAEIVRRCQLSVISFQLDQKAKLTAARYCTVSVVEPEMPSRLAKMFAVPFPVEYAIPLRVTTAIAGSDAVHCTYGVAIWVAESLKVTVAVKGHYGLGTEEMLNPQSTVIAGNEQPGPNGSVSSDANSYLDSSNVTGLIPFQEFDLFKYNLERRRLGHVWRQHVHGDQSVEVFLHRCFAAERTSSGHRGAETAVGFVIECADSRLRSN
jgi:hypothetical protein